jgi:hypothetical protein
MLVALALFKENNMAITKIQFASPEDFKNKNNEAFQFPKPASVPRLWKPGVKEALAAAAAAKNKTAKAAQLSTLVFGEAEKEAKVAKKKAKKPE